MPLSEQELRQVRDAAVRAIDQVFAVLAASAARMPETKPPTAPIPPAPAATPDPHARMAYTVKEAAALLGLSRGTIYKLLAEGRLTSTRIGSRRLFRVADLKALLEDA